MNTIEITDVINIANGFKFTLDSNLTLSNNNILIYVDNVKLDFSKFAISKEDLYYVVRFIDVLSYNKISFFVSINGIESNICLIFYNLSMIDYQNHSFNYISINCQTELPSSEYEIYAFKFTDYTITSNIITFTFCNEINSDISYIKLISEDDENLNFEIALFDKFGNSVPDGSYLIELIYN